MHWILMAVLLTVPTLTTIASHHEDSEEKKYLYLENFEEIDVDDYPLDFLVLDGYFAVVESDGGRVLELPATPLNSFGAIFGPTQNSDLYIQAEFKSDRRGRVGPRFGVGLCGVNGYKLRITPNKRALELYDGEDVVQEVPFRWKSNEWATIHLQIRQTEESKWIVEGKAWQGEDVPEEWMISFETEEEPNNGKPSIWGTPYSEKPIWFDNIIIDNASK